MKKTLQLTLGSWLASLIVVSAQNYSVDWFTIDGGGGVSTGGVYSISGTIGQADAGGMSGGNYTLQGGFWGIAVAVQTEGAPLLTITRSGSNVVISWPSPAGGFVLQDSAVLGTMNWTNVIQTVVTNGDTISVAVPATFGNRFYRLKK